EILDNGVDRLLDAALQRHRVRTRGDVLQALADDRLSKHGRRGGAVARNVVGRRGDLAHELGTLVLEDVLDLDLTCDRDAVVGDRRRPELLVEDDVPAFGTERDLDRIGQDVDAALERPARVLVELQLLVSHFSIPPFRLTTPWRRRGLSCPSPWHPWTRPSRAHPTRAGC